MGKKSMFPTQRVEEIGRVFMKFFLILLIFGTFRTSLISASVFQFAAHPDVNVYSAVFSSVSSSGLDSLLDYRFTLSYDGRLTAGTELLLNTPYFALGDISHDLRVKAVNGSYLTQASQPVPFLEFSPRRADPSDISVSHIFADGSFLFISSLRREQRQTMALSYVEGNFGVAIRSESPFPDIDSYIIEWNSYARGLTMNAYLLQQRDYRFLFLESYINFAGESISIRNFAEIDFHDGQTVSYTQIMFAREVGSWDDELSCFNRREECRHQLRYRFESAPLSIELFWEYRTYRRLPFALYQGEVKEKGGWRWSSGNWSAGFSSRVFFDESGRGNRSLSGYLAIKGRIWKSRVSFTFEEDDISLSLSIQVSSERIQTILKCTFDERPVLSCTMHLTFPTDAGEGKVTVCEQGFQEIKVTIGR